MRFCEKNNIKKIYWEGKKEAFSTVEILDNIDYGSIIQNIIFEDNKQIKPLYIKKPNIS